MKSSSMYLNFTFIILLLGLVSHQLNNIHDVVDELSKNVCRKTNSKNK